MLNAGASGPARFVSKLIALVALLAAPAANAQDIYRDGFENGGLPNWTYIAPQGSVVNTGCRTGARCLQMRVIGGVDQQSIFAEKDIPDHAGETLYVEAAFRFEPGFSWDPGGQPWGYEHKMFIVNTKNDVGRLRVNLRGGGISPTLAVHFERLESLGNGISKYSTVRWPTDGKWHKLGVEVQRVAGTNGHLRLWLDNTLALDETGRVCGSPCSPVRDVQIGAFSNQGAPKTQYFWVDDAVVSASPRAAAAAPVVTPPPPTTARVEALEAIAAAGEALDAAQAALVQAVEALDEQ